MAAHFDDILDKYVAKTRVDMGKFVIKLTNNVNVVFRKVKRKVGKHKKKLHPIEEPNDKVYLPPTCFTLIPEEKRTFCKCLHEVRVPNGFASNINNILSMNDSTLLGYNSHESHVMLTVFLSIANLKSGQSNHCT
uniref:Uncharacterized protein n=1 Tax=Oryza brachyantha TaxID=4533 RepID=J3L132_ORYBR